MLTRRTASGALALTLALGAAACSDDGNEVTAPSFDTTPAPLTAAPTTEAVSTTTAAPATSATSATSTTTASTTSSAAVETTVASTETDGLTGPMFSDALGVKVDSAPGVTTRGDTRQLLPEGLYVHLAWEADPNDPSVFTPQPDDVEILEAYANAVLTYYRAATTILTTDDPDFDRYYADGGAKYDKSFQEARDGGYTLSLGAGVLLRPYVLADQRDEATAVVLDCYLQNEQYVTDRSEVVLAPLSQTAGIATMVKRDGAWIVDAITLEPRACL